MEPQAHNGGQQFEIQLGHLCNNRCVFCISGALTHRREAPFLDERVLCAQLDQAFAAGHRRVTLLGGEPTIQPYFLDVVRHAVALGFDEIVIFSNGSKPGRTDLIDEVLATGGRFEWRFSFQGATREAHERTTRRKGSFAQIVRSLDRVRARDQKATANMCVVAQNYGSLPEFPSLLLPRGVSQLHVDMLNPYDTGTFGAAPDPDLQPRYSALREPLKQMVRGFPAGFDVNIGNLPYCVAPELAPWIHHGGQPTWTVSADDAGTAALKPERPKYLMKASHKVKPPGCKGCLFDDRCDGVFQVYTEWHGADELRAVTAERLGEVDPERRLLALHLRPLLREALRPERLPEPFSRAHVAEHDLRSVTLTLTAQALGEQPEARLVLRLLPNEVGAGGLRASWFRATLVEAAGESDALLEALRALWRHLEAAGAETVAPPGDDLVLRARPVVGAALGRLRAAAPFGALRWRDLRLDAVGARAELRLATAEDERATVWIAEQGGRAVGGYRVEAGGAEPSEVMRSGLRRLVSALA